jgi:hypothetical protein
MQTRGGNEQQQQGQGRCHDSPHLSRACDFETKAQNRRAALTHPGAALNQLQKRRVQKRQKITKNK